MKKILCLSSMFHGIRVDSGKVGVNPSESFSVIDANPNIVVKLTDINPMFVGVNKRDIVEKISSIKLSPCEKVKFIELKKEKWIESLSKKIAYDYKN